MDATRSPGLRRPLHADGPACLPQARTATGWGYLSEVNSQLPGFLENRNQFYDASDVEGAGVRQFIAAWWDAYANTEVGIRELWPLVDGDEPIPLPLGEKGERSQKTALGRFVANLRDRTFGDHRLLKCGTRQRAQLWRLVTVAE